MLSPALADDGVSPGEVPMRVAHSEVEGGCAFRAMVSRALADEGVSPEERPMRVGHSEVEGGCVPRATVSLALADEGVSPDKVPLRAARSEAEGGCMVRAVSSKHVLHRFGHMFSSVPMPDAGQAVSPAACLLGIGEEEAERLYALSYPAVLIFRFLSHSWNAGRLAKWAALSDLYHRNIAVLLATSYWALAYALGLWARVYREQLPTFFQALCIYLLAPCLVIFATYAFGHVAFRKWTETNCFLDKLCIHQSNAELKTAGIRSIGTCLLISERMTILWSADYFDRLWCIYEIATFGSHNGAGDIEFVPLWLCPFLMGMLLCNVVVMVASFVLQGNPWFADLLAYFGASRGIGVFWVITNSVPAVILCLIMREKVSRHRAIEDRLTRFTLDNTKVTVEEDRDVLHEKIRDLFGSLEQFERFIKTDFRDAFVRSLGTPWSVPYTWAVFIAQPFLWYKSTDSLAITDELVTAQGGLYGWVSYAISNACGYIGFTFVMLPAAVKMAGLSAHFTSRWPRALGLAFDVLVYQTTTFLCAAAGTFLVLLLFQHAVDSTVLAPVPVAQ